MEAKAYKAKVKIAGNSLAVIVPSWIQKAFDVNKGDEVMVKLDKITGYLTKDNAFFPEKSTSKASKPLPP